MNRSTLTVSQYMSPCPFTIDQAQPMSEAHRLMRQRHIRHLPVMHEGELVGIVSAGDLHFLETLQGVDPERVRVEEAMTPAPYCVRPDASLEEVADYMAANKYGCALVVQGRELVGIFTTVDALQALAQVLRVH